MLAPCRWRGAGPARRALQIGLPESLRLWHTGFLDGLPDGWCCAGSRRVAIDLRRTSVDLRNCREWPRLRVSGDRDDRRASDRNHHMAQCPARLFAPPTMLGRTNINRLSAEGAAANGLGECDTPGNALAGSGRGTRGGPRRRATPVVIAIQQRIARRCRPGQWHRPGFEARVRGARHGAMAGMRAAGGWFRARVRAGALRREPTVVAGDAARARHATPRHLGDRCPRTA